MIAVVVHQTWTHDWYKWGPASLLALIGIIAVLWKVVRVVGRVDSALPTLIKIADEFKPNGGNSLKDQLTRIEADGRQRADMLAEHSRMDEDRFARIESSVGRVEGMLLAQQATEQVEETPAPRKRAPRKTAS